MNIIRSLVSRSAAPVLIAGSLLHGLLFLLFLASLYVAAPSAARAAENGEPPACQGENLYAALKDRSPDIAEEAERSFAETPNAKGRLWRVEREGVTPSYLFGTVHTTDPRALALPPAAEAAFQGADTYVMEAADARSELSATIAMARNPGLFLYTDGSSAFDELDTDDREAVDKALTRRGVDPQTARRLKPWLIAGMLAAPPCELQRKAAGLEFLDNELANRAENAGKPVEGLETLVSQMEALASMPMERHIEGLADAAALDAHAADMTETLTALYLAGDLGLIMPALEAISEDLQGPLDAEQRAAVEAFEEKIVTTRNHHMAEAALPFLADGNAFIAVGALHLPGEEGVVQLLKDGGWTVNPVAID